MDTQKNYFLLVMSNFFDDVCTISIMTKRNTKEEKKFGEIPTLRRMLFLYLHNKCRCGEEEAFLEEIYHLALFRRCRTLTHFVTLRFTFFPEGGPGADFHEAGENRQRIVRRGVQRRRQSDTTNRCHKNHRPGGG